MSSQGFGLETFLELEESMAGKPGYTLDENRSAQITAATAVFAILYSILGPGGLIELRSAAIEAGGGVLNSSVYAALAGLTLAFAIWISLTIVTKFTPRKTLLTAILGLLSSWLIFIVVEGLGYFVLVEAEWEVVWANRVLVIVGQQMTEQMTQAPGSEFCISTCYGLNQNFRLWWILYPTFGVIAAAYGTTADHPAKFLVPFTIVWGFFALIAWTPTEINYHSEVPLANLSIALLVAYLCYGGSYWYCSRAEEYKAVRLRSYITIAAVFTFFFAIAVMDPPQIVKDVAVFFGATPAQEMASGTPSSLDKLAGNGIEASQWGGLFVNLIVATAGCVLGFGIGVVLAFGRQSPLPFFKVPSVLLIELVRSGPMICWLWFAVFLMPDLIDPFYDTEDIMRMLLIFGLFGGCYIAEVIRGGLQAVDSGQKEAAMALGLTSFQTKMTVELPNAVRTTLPSIVSVFIGLWKDTTLLFIINILDFFKLAKDLPNTDLRFLGDFLEPLYVTALVFWAFAFYLSRVSMRIEKSLGLVKEGGGELA